MNTKTLTRGEARAQQFFANALSAPDMTLLVLNGGSIKTETLHGTEVYSAVVSSRAHASSPDGIVYIPVEELDAYDKGYSGTPHPRFIVPGWSGEVGHYAYGSGPVRSWAGAVDKDSNEVAR